MADQRLRGYWLMDQASMKGGQTMIFEGSSGTRCDDAYAARGVGANVQAGVGQEAKIR